ncbi:MAG: hypothetical protein M1819_007330 [Sarea resinae]|nr:MAG: hypothetical protein M1819_007330 [Sarea resinae]
MESISELDGKAFPENLPDLVERLQESIQSHPGNLALVCTHQPADLYGIGSVALDDDEYRRQPYLRWTYKTLDESIDRLANALESRGVSQGTPLFIFVANTAEYVLASWAAYRLGCVHVPINPSNLSNTEEVKHMIRTVVGLHKSQPVAILAGSPDLARRIDDLNLGLDSVKIAVDGPAGGWIPFDDLMKAVDTPSEPIQQRYSRSQSSDTSIFFTSGTTSLPKGCFTRGSPFIASLEWRHSHGAALAGDATAVVVPNNHAIGFICLMTTLTHGATVVFPGPTFAPQAMMDAMQRERCTHTAMVPTMIHALMGVKPSDGGTLDSLKGIMLAGSLLTPEILRLCQEEFGASGVENMYGMTEGVLVSTGHVQDISDIVKGGDVAIGIPAGGSKIRICAPGERTPLPRGIAGELHFSGRQLIGEYISKKVDDFYNGDDGRKWFITGDQALIDADGRLYIVGRYKDMIIRGGENIAPGAIESLLGKTPELRALGPQIVGAPDPIAGEVPVAVVSQDIGHDLVKLLQDTILANMGARYVPDDVLSLQSLGLEDYPRTMAGKVQKTKLASLVRKYRESQESAPINGSFDRSVLEETVKRIWAHVVGLDVSEVDTDARISDFSDSITLMMVREKIRKETGRSVPLSEWAAVHTISAQIKLLENAKTDQQARPATARTRRPGPPAVDDMVHAAGDSNLFEATKDLIEKTIAPFGLGWKDVEDVMPATDFIQAICRTQVVDTWNIRTAILTNGADTKQLRSALERTLENNPLMLSFLVLGESTLGPDLALYVTVSNTKELLDQCILDHGVVDTLEDVRNITMHYPYKDHAMLPGPLFRAITVFVKETKSAALVYNASHAILDATYHNMFNEDLDIALSGMTLSPHTSYKAWADSYHSLRTSPSALGAVAYHMTHLRTLLEHKHALWPLSTPTLTVAPERASIDGHFTTFSAPGILSLRRTHPALTATVVLKAATALLALYHTKHSHALFVNLEAARSHFPFIPTSLSAVGNFEAADVAGPTFNAVLNIVTIHPGETVLQFLHRMQGTQTDLIRHANAPWHEIARQIGPPAGDLLPQVADSLIFNWMPGLGAAAGGMNPRAHMQVMQVCIRTKLGMLVNAGMGGKDGSQIVLHLQGALANTSTEGIQWVAEGLEKISTWLAEKDSWDQPVETFTECLGVAT